MLRRLFGLPTQAQSAGQKAGRTWKNILYHTSSDLEDLTGLDAYTHARAEAQKWLESYVHAQNITIPGVIKLSKINQHGMFLEYVEGFLQELAPELRSKGQPKE